jgi:L-cysteine desulfidase
MFTFSEYLKFEWVRTFGCTEPAAIAFAAAKASELARGKSADDLVKGVSVRVDPRIFKNCFAVGIPYSDHKTGIEWATAIGSVLPSAEGKLECFRQTTPEVLSKAKELIDGKHVRVQVEVAREDLLIDCRVATDMGSGRVVIEDDHTNIVHAERDDIPVDLSGTHRRGMSRQLPYDMMIARSVSRTSEPTEGITTATAMRAVVAKLSFGEMIDLAKDITKEDRATLREGAQINLRMADHGLTLFPKKFIHMSEDEKLTRVSKMVCGGVYARMWGEDMPVMSLAGSGNKGIVVSVPLITWGEMSKASKKRIEEALALACLVTSATTHHLGTLSAVCGCSNAAGIGLAAGLVYLDRGTPKEINLAINNMVGNVSGMICDGAKIGCALKTMTAVDAAFRAASLAMADLGIPYSDGIIGYDGPSSLNNLGRIAGPGMKSMDEEILKIMTEKLQNQ